jgi:hypothetical protein
MVQPYFRFGSQQPHTISEFLWSHPEAPIKTSYAAQVCSQLLSLEENHKEGQAGRIKEI